MHCVVLYRKLPRLSDIVERERERERKMDFVFPPQVLVQPSTRRAYSMNEYKAAGAIITDDLSSADAIVGKMTHP